MNDKHISTQFDAELTGISSRVLEMGGLAESQLAQAMIALSQFKDLLGLSIDKMPADFFSQIGTLWLHLGSFNPWALAIGLTCFGGLFLWPRLFVSGAFTEKLIEGPSIKALSRVPGPVVAL